MYETRLIHSTTGCNPAHSRYASARTQKDASNRRGYSQKSVILLRLCPLSLSRYPYVGLFKRVMQIIAPLYHKFGHSLLEATYHSISQGWPDHAVGRDCSLPLMGSLLHFVVPPPGASEDIGSVLTSKQQLGSNLQVCHPSLSGRQSVHYVP